MKIGLDLSWMTKDNQHGGVFQYGLRLASALVQYSDQQITVITSESCETLFAELMENRNFRVLVKPPGYILTPLIEREHIDVVHTPMQRLFNYTLAVPMVSTLHDLQHFHFPEFFTSEQIEYRNSFYKKSAEFSERVTVSFQHVKDDIVKFYGINPDKIDVCPVGMPKLPSVTTEQVAAVRGKYSLPEKYLLYSANFWRHKNHIGLLRALRCYLNKFGGVPKLVLTGHQDGDFYPHVRKVVDELDLEDHVTFTGYLSEEELHALLKGAELSIIPTLYEAGSYPLLEAMVLGVPVICSEVTSLPDSIGDRRFLFNPNSPEEIADRMAEMLTNKLFVEENIANSRRRVLEHSWRKVADGFVATYEKAVAGFEIKKRPEYFSYWTTNYDFFMVDAQDRSRSESEQSVKAMEKLQAEVAETSKQVEEIQASICWRMTGPIRWLLDKQHR